MPMIIAFTLVLKKLCTFQGFLFDHWLKFVFQPGRSLSESRSFPSFEKFEMTWTVSSPISPSEIKISFSFTESHLTNSNKLYICGSNKIISIYLMEYIRTFYLNESYCWLNQQTFGFSFNIFLKIMPNKFDCLWVLKFLKIHSPWSQFLLYYQFSKTNLLRF